MAEKPLLLTLRAVPELERLPLPSMNLDLFATRSLSLAPKADFTETHVLLASEQAFLHFEKTGLSLRGKTCICVGSKLALLLRSREIQPLCLKRMLDLEDHTGLQNIRILYPCSEAYDRQEVENLNHRGYCLNPLPIYQPIIREPDPDLLHSLKNHRLWALVLSASQAQFFVHSDLKCEQFFCLGQRTLKTLRRLGLNPVKCSPEPDIESLIQTIALEWKENAVS